MDGVGRGRKDDQHHVSKFSSCGSDPKDKKLATVNVRNGRYEEKKKNKKWANVIFSFYSTFWSIFFWYVHFECNWSLTALLTFL